MLTVRRQEERSHRRRRSAQSWHTFDQRRPAQVPPFGALVGLDEHRLRKGADLPDRPLRGCEQITYVHEGFISCERANAKSGLLQAGEFQRLTVGSRARLLAPTRSTTEGVHLFQVRLQTPSPDYEQPIEQKRFSFAARRGGLCIIASPDGHQGSMRLGRDVCLFSTLLADGQHLIHEVPAGAAVWVHVVEGQIGFGRLVLAPGDGVGLTGERVLSFTALSGTELLIVELGPGERDQNAL